MKKSNYQNSPTPRMFTNLGIQLTRKCNLKCKHCCQGGLDRSAVVPQNIALNFVKQASEIECEQIGITGGEVFLERDLLRVVVDECYKHNIQCTVLTSGFWGKTPQIAKSYLKEMPGMTNLAISYDEWHAEFVSSKQVVNCLQSALDLGKKVSICSSYLKGGKESQIDWLKNSFGDEIIKHIDIKMQPVLLHGDAEKNFKQCDLFQYDLWNSKCTAIHKPLLAPDGTVYACCGASQDIPGDHFLNLGSIHNASLCEIRDRTEKNMALQAIRFDGPGGLAKALGISIDINLAPKDICDICILLCNKYSSSQINDKLSDKTNYLRSIAVKRLYQEGSIHSFSLVQDFENV